MARRGDQAAALKLAGGVVRGEHVLLRKA